MELTVWNVKLKPTFPASFVVGMITVGCSTPGGSRDLSMVTATVVIFSSYTVHCIYCNVNICSLSFH